MDTASALQEDLPLIVAAFCVVFDVRKGYTIAWSKSIDSVELDGVVEYKSLPSGLHNVSEDLVYFVHEQYAGISAFLNKQGDASERNARMLAVGVLVPHENARMGRSWLYAEPLENFVRSQVEHLDDFEELEQFWSEHKVSDDYTDHQTAVESPTDGFTNGSAQQPPNGYRKTRAMSDSAPYATGTKSLTRHHPAISLPQLLTTFGPLIFPLYRAALLRKKILIVGEAPVEINCNYVYALSILSSIQRALLPLLPIDEIPDMKLRTLFNIGIQDIPLLSKFNESSETQTAISNGWIACTTDDVLATKPNLFDILVVLPPPHSKDASTKIYPKIAPSSPELSKSPPSTSVRSTQRDARRYIHLRANLRKFAASSSEPNLEAAVDDVETRSLSSTASSTLSRTSIVEPTSWSLMAYTSLIWWASAGEKKTGPADDDEQEAEQDAQLLGNDYEMEEPTSAELEIVAYFHRLTNVIFATISDAISRVDHEDVAVESVENEHTDPFESNGEVQAAGEENEEETLLQGEENNEVIEINQDDLVRMGLDIWSASDRTFLEDLVRMWWGRDAVVKGGRIKCCGVQIL